MFQEWYEFWTTLTECTRIRKLKGHLLTQVHLEGLEATHHSIK